jgi:hypothetical protein
MKTSKKISQAEKSNVVMIRTGLPKQMIDNMRNCFSIPKEVKDGELFEALLNNLIDRYWSIEYFSQDDIDIIFGLCPFCHQVQDADGRCKCTNRDSD